MKKFLFLFVAFTLVFANVSCKNSKFKKTDSGLSYKFHVENKGEKPSIDNVVNIHFAYRYPADSVFYHSNMAGEPGYIKIQPSDYPGDIYEALRMMSKGDSATFIFDAHRFFTISAGSPSVPPFMSETDSLFVDIIMFDFFNEEQFQAHMDAQREEMMQEQEVLASNELKNLDKYLADNSIKEEPLESGLIIIVNEQGKGEMPKAGQEVSVHYTGMLLDGTVFDSSLERGEPISFSVGNGRVIRGWDEAFTRLRVGSKARLIIPSHLAYGGREAGPVIKPFSTLIFDVELLSAK
jgi:FKBP-type peptidyl-prolyl cis-trans isomerase FkpA